MNRADERSGAVIGALLADRCLRSSSMSASNECVCTCDTAGLGGNEIDPSVRIGVIESEP